MHEDALKPTLSAADFQTRFEQLHRQLWCSSESAFNDVTHHIFAPPKGMYQVDHSFIHDGTNWHCYYVTGDMRRTEPWVAAYSSGDYQAANDVCIEPGNGHAVGKTIADMKFVENVFLPPQGVFDLASRGVCSLFRFRGRYGMLYDARGDRGNVMCLAWSDDLSHWEQVERNPVLVAPPWAQPRGAFKDPHVMEHNGVYLIYVIEWDKEGSPCIGLFTTDDWEHFHDQGKVLRMTPQMRGTFGIESPQVLLRDGMWHLFFTQGPGLWHAVSPSPAQFLSGENAFSHKVLRGAYWVGPFHATEFVQDGEGGEGGWFMTTDRKEETRRLNRVAGRMCPRGSYEDEKTLEEGMYLSRVKWKGDQPTFAKP